MAGLSAIPTICQQITDVAVQCSIRKIFCDVPTWMPATSTGMTAPMWGVAAILAESEAQWFRAALEIKCIYAAAELLWLEPRAGATP